MLKNKKNLKNVPNAFVEGEQIVVSVIVDVFNHAKYLRQNFDSILSQKVNFNVEILVHDDCSNDGSQEIIREYEKKYPQIIKPIYQVKNQYSQNIEIDAEYNYPRIAGDFVAMCEGDDYWCDDCKLYKQVSYLRKHKNISAYIARTIRLNLRDNKKGYYGLAKDCFSKKYTLKDLIKGKDFSISSLLARKEYFEKPFPDFVNIFVGFTDIQLGYYLCLNHKIYYDSHPMSVYRQYSSPTSFTSSFSKLDEDSKLKTYENRIKVLELLLEVVPHRYRNILVKRIKQERFTLLVIKKDYDALNSNEFIKLFKRKQRHERIKKVLKIKH